MLLTNSNFVTELGRSLWGLKQRGHYCDLYLKCAGDEDVLLHTCVAAASSPFIQSVLDSVDAGGDKSNMGFAIPVPAVNADIMALVAEFMYTGQVELDPESLFAVLDTANYFEVSALSELCHDQIKMLNMLTTPIKETKSEDNVVNTIDEAENKYEDRVVDSVDLEENKSEDNVVDRQINEDGEQAMAIDAQPMEDVPNEDYEAVDMLAEKHTDEIPKDSLDNENACLDTIVSIKMEGVTTAVQSEIVNEDVNNEAVVGELHEDGPGSASPPPAKRTRKRKIIEDCVDPDEALAQEQIGDDPAISESGVSQQGDPQEEQEGSSENFQESNENVSEPLESSEGAMGQLGDSESSSIVFAVESGPEMGVKKETPLKWTHRISNKDKSRILDLIRKKPKPDLPVKIETLEEEEQRIVTEEEEASLYDGRRFSCPLCDRTFFRKFNWCFHLDRQHDVQVESIAKNVDLTKDSIEGGQTAISPSIAQLLAHEDAVEETEEVAQLDPMPTPGETAALVELIKAKAILQKYRPNKYGGVGKKKRFDKECPECGKFFKYDTFYEEHVRKHSDPKPYKCNFCSSEYATRSIWLTHMESHTRTKPKFECDECESVFSTAARLNQHVRLMHTVSKSTCTECGKACRNEMALRAHVRAVHTKHMFTCPVEGCGKVVAKNREAEHMNIHTKEYMFECDMCDNKYTQKTSLDFHKRSKHKVGAEEEWRCEECNQTFVCKQGLDKHMKRHKGEKQFTCKECGARFFTKGEMQQHEAYHAAPSDRQHICPVCQKSFVREYSLRNHMLTHTADKPFTCEYCQKKFRWKNKLKEHVRKHTGENPFKCRICEARFPDCAIRRHHEKRAHAEEISRNPSLLPRSHTRSNKFPGSVNVKSALPVGSQLAKTNARSEHAAKRLKTSDSTAAPVSIVNMDTVDTMEYLVAPDNAVVINAEDLNKAASAHTVSEQFIVLQHDVTSGVNNEGAAAAMMELPNVTEEMAKIFVIDKHVEGHHLEGGGHEVIDAAFGQATEEDGYVSFIDSNGEQITVKYVEESA